MDFDHESSGDQIVSQIRGNIQKLSVQVREIETWLPRVAGDSAEGERNREEFNNLANHANRLAKDTNRLMQQLVHLSNSDRGIRVERERLQDEFMQQLNRLQAVQRSAERAQKESIMRVQYTQEQEEEEAMRRAEAASFDNSRQLQMRQQQKANIHEIKERTQALQELERDIADVQTIFVDLAKIVHEQGEMVDSIEVNVEHAQMHVQTGADQLTQAVYYNNKARQKKLMLFIFLLVLLFIIGLTVYFYLK